MRALLVLLSCAACNQLLHLDEVTPEDAAVPVDVAHYTCDPLPTFTASPTMYLANCTDYTSDSHADQLAVAFCGGGANGGVIQQGVPGSTAMTPATLGNNDATIKEAPRLGPAGDTMFVRTPSPAQMGGAVFREFQLASGTRWVEGGFMMIPFVPSVTDVISTPTSGTVSRHVVVHHTDATNAQTFIELIETQFQGWKPFSTFTPADLGVTTFADPFLSDDGLALWFVGTVAGDPPAMYASIRTGTDVPFPPAAKVTTPTIPTPASPFLTRQCERLYISDGTSTSYLLH